MESNYYNVKFLTDMDELKRKCDIYNCIICKDILTHPARVVKTFPECECNYYVCVKCICEYVEDCNKSNVNPKCLIC